MKFFALLPFVASAIFAPLSLASVVKRDAVDDLALVIQGIHKQVDALTVSINEFGTESTADAAFGIHASARDLDDQVNNATVSLLNIVIDNFKTSNGSAIDEAQANFIISICILSFAQANDVVSVITSIKPAVQKLAGVPVGLFQSLFLNDLKALNGSFSQFDDIFLTAVPDSLKAQVKGGNANTGVVFSKAIAAYSTA